MAALSCIKVHLGASWISGGRVRLELATVPLDHEKASASEVGSAHGGVSQTNPLWVVLAWTAVGIPLVWGIYRTLLSVGKFFN